MIREFEHLEQLYQEFTEAYRTFAEKDQAARTTISLVSRRIREAKRQTDEAVQQAKLTIADPSRSTAAGVRLEALLSRSFPVTPEETEAMNKAVADADAAYTAAKLTRTRFDEAHDAAFRKLRAMRDDVFGNVPSAMNLMHTNQMLHDRLCAVQEEAK